MISPKPTCKEIKAILKAIKNVPVAILGDVCLDEYIYGEVNQISKEAPVPVLQVEKKIYYPGQMTNVALNLAALGGYVYPISILGQDAEGLKLKKLLQETDHAGYIDTNYLITSSDWITTHKVKLVATSGQHIAHQHVFHHYTEPKTVLNSDLSHKIIEALQIVLPKVKGLILSDYGYAESFSAALASKKKEPDWIGIFSQELIKDLLYLIQPYRKKTTNQDNLVVTLDSRYGLMRFSKLDLTTPSNEELQAFYPELDLQTRPEDILKAAQEYCSTKEISAALITLGAKGLLGYQNPAFSRDKNPEPIWLDSANKQPLDITGAGDTVLAAASLVLAAGFPYTTAAWLANQAAGISISKPGTSTVKPEELAQLI